MGYTTEFRGQITVKPPMSPETIARLKKFAEDESRHKVGPGGYCQWMPTEDGTAIVWDGGEKFYNSVEWMGYIINTFLQGHTCNGTINAQGEEMDDRWQLVVVNNRVTAKQGRVVYD